MTQDTTTTDRVLGLTDHRPQIVMDAPEDYDALDEMSREPVPLWERALWLVIYICILAVVAGLVGKLVLKAILLIAAAP